MACPSGLQTGLVSLAGSAVRRTGAPPSLASTVQMSLRRRFASRSSVLTVNASREWALELASSDRRSIATRSWTVKPAGAARAAVPAAITRKMTRPRRMRRISLDEQGVQRRIVLRAVQYARRFRSGGRVRSMTDGRDIRGGGRGQVAAAVAGRRDGRGGLRRWPRGGPAGRAAAGGGRGGDAGQRARRAHQRVHRHRQVAPIDDDPAAGGRHHPRRLRSPRAPA